MPLAAAPLLWLSRWRGCSGIALSAPPLPAHEPKPIGIVIWRRYSSSSGSRTKHSSMGSSRLGMLRRRAIPIRVIPSRGGRSYEWKCLPGEAWEQGRSYLTPKFGQLATQCFVLCRQLDDALAQFEQFVIVSRALRRLGLVTRLAARLTYAFGRLLQLVATSDSGSTLLFGRKRRHCGGSIDRQRAGFHRFHDFRSGLLLDLLDHADLAVAQSCFARKRFTADHRLGTRRIGNGRDLTRVGRLDRHLYFHWLIGIARATAPLGQDGALAQCQHAALKRRDAASAQMLVDHPQVYVVHRLKLRVLHRLEWQIMLAAHAVAMVTIDQHLAPQHQRVTTTLGQDASLQRLVFLRGHRVDIGLEFFIDDDVHDHNYPLEERGSIVEMMGRFADPLGRKVGHCVACKAVPSAL